VKVNLAINKPYEQWNVVDVFNLLEEEIEVTVDIHDDLHLPADDDSYLVYDFWNQEYLGEITRSFPIQLRPCASKVFAVRKKLGHPQVLSTSRHISQGAFDLLSLTWDENSKTLAGVSKMVAGDPYEIVLYVPDGYEVSNEGNKKLNRDLKKEGMNLWVIQFNPGTTGEVAWSVTFD